MTRNNLCIIYISSVKSHKVTKVFEIGFSGELPQQTLTEMGNILPTGQEPKVHLYTLSFSKIINLNVYGHQALLPCLREKIHYQQRQRFMLGEETEKANDEIP